MMSIQARKYQILEVLVENLRNPQPQVVSSEMIANKLEMNVEETCSLLKVMHDMGIVISDSEGMSALITREGISSISQYTVGFGKVEDRAFCNHV